MKGWRTWIPLLTLVGIGVGFLARRVLTPRPEPLVIQPLPATNIPALDLPDRHRALEGRVVDPSGAGVADALVWVRAGNSPQWRYTDAQGRFRFASIEDPPWRATVLAHGFEPHVEELPGAEAPVAIRLDAPFAPPPALPKIARAALSGTLTSRLGPVPEGCEVVFTPASPPETISGPLPRRATADASGRFAVEDLILGEYLVEVLPAWARGGSWPDLARPIEGGAPRRVVHPAGGTPELALELSTGEATGKLLDVHGDPIEGALILATPAADPGRVFPPVASGPDGSFAIRGLPAGRYAVAIRAGKAAMKAEVAIAAGQSAGLELAPIEIRRSQ
jgi:hypothetical protein